MAHLICVPQVPQMWYKMWYNSIYILSTNQYMSMKIRSISAPGVQTGTRALIKHGEIGEDSKAAPQKLNHQPFAKNQN